VGGETKVIFFCFFISLGQRGGKDRAGAVSRGYGTVPVLETEGEL
jgi:hypothetical protein